MPTSRKSFKRMLERSDTHFRWLVQYADEMEQMVDGRGDKLEEAVMMYRLTLAQAMQVKDIIQNLWF